MSREMFTIGSGSASLTPSCSSRPPPAWSRSKGSRGSLRQCSGPGRLHFRFAQLDQMLKVEHIGLDDGLQLRRLFAFGPEFRSRSL